MKSFEQIQAEMKERWNEELAVRFQCPACGRKFVRYPGGQLEIHLTHWGNQYYKTICPGCGEKIVKF